MAPSSSNPLLLLLLSSPILLLVLILQAGSGQASRGEEALVEFPQVHKKNLIRCNCVILNHFSLRNKECSTLQSEVSLNSRIRKWNILDFKALKHIDIVLILPQNGTYTIHKNWNTFFEGVVPIWPPHLKISFTRWHFSSRCMLHRLTLSELFHIVKVNKYNIWTGNYI